MEIIEKIKWLNRGIALGKKVNGKLEIVDNCKYCGKPITDYEKVEMVDDELRKTYHCSCGYCGEQIFGLKYKRTEDMQ